MDFSLSLSLSALLREPVAIYLPVSNYLLVNTLKGADTYITPVAAAVSPFSDFHTVNCYSFRCSTL